jgi:hypothetical protein
MRNVSSNESQTWPLLKHVMGFMFYMSIEVTFLVCLENYCFQIIFEVSRPDTDIQICLHSSQQILLGVCLVHLTGDMLGYLPEHQFHIRAIQMKHSHPVHAISISVAVTEVEKSIE